jgi:acyl carrier protein
MLHAQHLQEVKDFVAEVISTSPQELTALTRLGEDLGLDGDDAEDFMQAFAHRFQVDLSDFHFDLHFGPEAAYNPFLSFYLWLFKPSALKLEPITIGDLVRAAKERKWHTAALGGV